MSVIAWDGTTLAADKRGCTGTIAFVTTKIFRCGEALCGYCGKSDIGEEMLAWVLAGRDPEKFPASQRADFSPFLMVWPDGQIWKFESTPHPIKIEGGRCAAGSGGDFALAAMHLGKTASEAVEIACLFDISSGNGIDTLRHA